MSTMRVRFRVDFGEDSAVGPGKIALLEKMRETGSLSQAARTLKMSYRRAWQLLDSLNHSFREPVVLTAIGGKGGGGATITPFGESLVAAYRELEADIIARAAEKLEPFLAQVASRKTSTRRALSKRSASRSKRVAKQGA